MRSRSGLGEDFLGAVDACFQRVRRNPELMPIAYQTYRRAIIRRFPFAVIYEAASNVITVYAVFPQCSRPRQMAPTSALAPRHVRGLSHPVRMSDIATEVGISLRSLQKAFVRQRGQTLTQFLRSARLELARKRLLAGLSGATVSSVALDCGFGHFGKFAGYYRARFGETPSQTLVRGLVAARHR